MTEPVSHLQLPHHPTAPQATPVVELSNVASRFGQVTAVDGVTLILYPDQVTELLGPNGAGKTTLVRQITALLRPCSGQIELLGQDVVRHPAVVPQYVGFFGQRAPILRNYTVAEVLVYAGILRGLSAVQARRQAQALIDHFDRPFDRHRARLRADPEV